MSLTLPLVNTPVGWSFFRTISTRSPGWRLPRTVPERVLAAGPSVALSSTELETSSSLKRPRNCSFGNERTYGEYVPLRIVCIACVLLILFALKRMQRAMLVDSSKAGPVSDISITWFRSIRNSLPLHSLENAKFYLAYIIPYSGQIRNKKRGADRCGLRLLVLWE